MVEGFSTPASKIRNEGHYRGIVPKNLLSLQSTPSDENDDDEIQSTRRQALVETLSVGAFLAGLTIMSNAEAASAYDKTYPVELDTSGADMRSPREKALAKTTATRSKPASPLNEDPLDLGLGAFLWGSAFWFLSGSRSNPLATGVANILYDSEKEDWLKDRNDGLFGDLPPPLLLVLGVIFLMIGFAVHIATISIVDGSMNISLQLSGVLLIGGGRNIDLPYTTNSLALQKPRPVDPQELTQSCRVTTIRLAVLPFLRLDEDHFLASVVLQHTDQPVVETTDFESSNE